ncbi:MAG: DcrB-related protein [Paracoccus sp. (in: a-proteobacteria)]
MTKCNTGTFTLDVPDDWSDRSMITWVAPPAPGYKVLPNLLCSKGDMHPGEDLDKFVNRQLKELMAQVRNFDLISRQNTLFGGLPAVELLFRMRPQNVMLQQRQLFFQTNPQSGTANTVVFTAAADDFDKLAPLFGQIMNSVSWNS